MAGVRKTMIVLAHNPRDGRRSLQAVEEPDVQNIRRAGPGFLPGIPEGKGRPIRVTILCMRVPSTGFRYLRLMLAVLLVLPYGGAADPPGQSPEVSAWAFHVVVSYDNDLDPHTQAIVDGWTRGAASGPPVTLLVDRVANDGLRRVLLRGNERIEETIPTEDCTDPSVIEAFLQWSREVAPARRVAVFFLNHGGKLDEMCLDDRVRFISSERSAGSPSAAVTPMRGWLSAAAVGDVLRRYASSLEASDSDFELLFLEQCARSTFENLYCFRDTARRVLASQDIVGAPNTYYEPLVSLAGRSPEVTADELADVVFAEDAYYVNYALVDGAQIGQMPEHVNELVEGLTRQEIDSGVDSEKAVGTVSPLPAVFEYAGQRHIDLLECLDKRYTGSNEAHERFAMWLREILVVRHRFNLGVDPARRKRCGISLIDVDASNESHARHPLFRESRWPELVQGLRAR